jgi:hypothetical protein
LSSYFVLWVFRKFSQVTVIENRVPREAALRHSPDEMNFVGMAQKPAKALPALKRGDTRAGTSGCSAKIEVA